MVRLFTRTALASLLAIVAVVALTDSRAAARTGEHVLTLGEVEASVRAVGLTYLVLPGTTIVQANGPGEYPKVWVNIRLFPSPSALTKSPVIPKADRYFPRAHSRDVVVCNAWVAPYTYWGFGVDRAPLHVSVLAARRIATQLRRRC